MTSSLSKPIIAGFGVRVDGHDTEITFSTAGEASKGAQHLTAQGYRQIDVFDRISGEVVEHVVPSPKFV